jgi:hypothetical protein
MNYYWCVENSFNAGKRNPDITAKWGVPSQVWDAPKLGEEEDFVGADNNVTLEGVNAILAPFNMVVHDGKLYGSKYWTLSVLNPDKPWPSNWSSVADEVVMCGERPHAKFGRKKWPPKEFTA